MKLKSVTLVVKAMVNRLEKILEFPFFFKNFPLLFLVTFKQDVSDIGGMVVYVNHFMGPSLEPKYISKDFESIWINLEMPDLVRFKDVGLAKPKVILGVVREPGMNSREFYQYLLDTIKIGNVNVVPHSNIIFFKYKNPNIFFSSSDYIQN